MTQTQISKNEIHIWYQKLDLGMSSALRHKYFACLSEQEQKMSHSFLALDKRLEYIVSRFHVRKILSKYIPEVFPTQWQFQTNQYGRPYIANPKSDLPLQFNITHCRGLIACAVGLECELGIDAEHVNESSDLKELANSYFSASEVQMIQNETTDLANKFYKLWTLKESYLKARGVGFLIPTQDFSFAINSKIVKFTVDSKLDTNYKNWQFKLIQPTPQHQLAIAIRQNIKSSLLIRENWAD